MPIVIQERTTSAGVWWLLGSAIFIVVAATIWIVRRRRQRDAELQAQAAEYALEASSLRARNLESEDWSARVAARRPSIAPQPTSAAPVRYSAAPMQSPAPVQPIVVSQAPPVIVNNSNSGLDNLVAFELGAMSNRRERDVVVERETIIEPAPSQSSSSSWDDSSSSASSWSGGDDSSSSSSDWSGGGGSDSGSGTDWGGGGDSGGGGSDW